MNPGSAGRRDRHIGPIKGIAIAASLACLLLAAAVGSRAADGLPIPRHILALYESDLPSAVVGPEAYAGNLQRLVEMPLNHLGLIVDYRNVRDGLPALETLGDVRGILIWIDEDLSMDPEAFLAWCEQAIDSGKRMVVMGSLPINAALQSGRIAPRRVNRFWERLGLRWQDDPVHISYRVEVRHKDATMVEYERPLPAHLPAFEALRVISPRVTSHLTLVDHARADAESDLVATGPAGGYVSENYMAYHAKGGFFLQWYLNPFEFFRLAFATDDLPKPDPTTLCGRRIFYSHIDGDGWRNETEAAGYKERRVSSAEVIYNEILLKFPDLPVTVGPIVADIDPDWYGTRDDLALARRMFALPNVEAGSHTYSHPLTWSAFAGVALPTSMVAVAGSGPDDDDHLSVFGAGGTPPALPAGREPPVRQAAGPRQVPQERPASYERAPFDLHREIGGSLDFLGRLCPPGKKVGLLQWSGNCCPFEAAVAEARAAGVRAINGGDSRFDADYPSCLWVAPMGRQIGSQRQIFASNSNEETYTDLWTDRYFGFRDLLETVKRTESPIRLQPFNIYYHMYSGEKDASLAALQANLTAARRQSLIPLTASHYAGIADGFFSARMIRVGPRIWRIEQRDRLQTVRFDAGVTGIVDLAASSGVIGQRRYQGSLYVALDPAAPSARIVLCDGPAGESIPASSVPCLMESRWPVWAVRNAPGILTFRTSGFGAGEMTWRMPAPGPVVVRVAKARRAIGEQTVLPKDGLCRFSLGMPDGPGPLDVTVQRKADGP